MMPIGRAHRRMLLAMLSRCAGQLALLLAAAGLMAWWSPVSWVTWLAGIAAAGCILANVRGLPSQLRAAVLLDEQSAMHELFSSALLAARSHDHSVFAAAVLAKADELAKTVAGVRLKASRYGIAEWTAAIIVTAVLLLASDVRREGRPIFSTASAESAGGMPKSAAGTVAKTSIAQPHPEPESADASGRFATEINDPRGKSTSAMRRSKGDLAGMAAGSGFASSGMRRSEDQPAPLLNPAWFTPTLAETAGKSGAGVTASEITGNSAAQASPGVAAPHRSGGNAEPFGSAYGGGQAATSPPLPAQYRSIVKAYFGR